MNDRQVRKAFKATVLRGHLLDPDTLVIDELGLRHGAARVDIAVVNGQILGFEIKSDIDKLDRLPNQAAIFSSVLDRVTLICGQKHTEKAVRIVPEWWGITVAKREGESVIQFDELTPAGDNPAPDPLATVKLLWRTEALSVLEKFEIADGLRSKPRIDIYRRLAGALEPNLLRASVLQQLRSRTNWRSAALQT